MRASMVGRGRNFACMGLPAHIAITLFAAAAALLPIALSGCAGMAKRSGEETQAGQAATAAPHSGQGDASPSSRKFAEPGELDKLLDAKPIALAAVKPASAAGPAGIAAPRAAEPAVVATVARGKGNFRIQVGEESDVDAAQAKKIEYEKLLGGPVDMVFDAPYYKLRWGFFDSKQDAEDKLLELSDYKIQGFVIKQ